MKRLLSLFCFIAILVTTLPTFAQSVKLNPPLKVGTIIQSDVSAGGQTYSLMLKISALGDDDITFDYDFQSTTSGKFVNSKANLEKGRYLNWDQPVPGEERKLSDSQSIVLVSRAFFKELKEAKKSTYDGKQLFVKQIPKGKEIIMGGQEVDAIYAESENGYSKYWILNNDKFPLLLRVEGTDVGLDLNVTSIR